MNVVGVVGGTDAEHTSDTSGTLRTSEVAKLPTVHVRPMSSSSYKEEGRIDYIQPAVKYLLFTFNFIFWLGGLMVMAGGVWVTLDKSGPIKDAMDIVFDPAIVVIISGFILFFLAFIGCIGSLRENIIFLRIYYIGLVCVVFAEFMMAIILMTIYYVPFLRRKVRMFDPSPVFKKAIVRYQDDENMQAMIDTVQRKFKCCGYSFSEEGYKDWGHNTYYNCSEHNKSVSRCGVPYSCCKPVKNEKINVMCGYEAVGENIVTLGKRIYLRGCLKGFGEWLEQHMTVIGGMFFAVLIPEVMAIKLARELTWEIETQKLQW